MGRIYQDIAIEEDAKARSIDSSKTVEKRRALSLVHQNNTNASEMFFLAASHKKTDKDLWSLAATSSTAAENHSRAAYCFKQMTGPGRLDTDLLLQQAKSYALAKEHRKALKQYRLLAEHLPDNITVVEGIANAHLGLKSLTSAAQVLAKSLEKMWSKWRKLKRGSRNFRLPPRPSLRRLTSAAERAINSGSVPIIGDLHLPKAEQNHRQETQPRLQTLQRDMLCIGKSVAFVYHELQQYAKARATIEQLQTQLSLPMNSLPPDIAVLLATCMLHTDIKADAFPHKLLSRRRECTPNQVRPSRTPNKVDRQRVGYWCEGMGVGYWCEGMGGGKWCKANRGMLLVWGNRGRLVV